jgi:copper transport outer membrane protein MctB
MISFRYHVVTIVSVFLALAVGILMGSTFLDPGLSNRLRAQVNQQNDAIDQYRTTLTAQQAELRDWETFGRAALPVLAAGRLADQSPVIVTDGSVDPSVLNAMRQALLAAGASTVGVLSVKAKMAAADAASRAQLATLLGLPATTSSARVTQAAAAALGGRLSEAPVSGAINDVLREMADQGFVSSAEFPPGELQGIGGPTVPVVVVAGGSQPPAVSAATFFVPLVTTLVDANQTVAAVEPLGSTVNFVPLIRDDSAIDGRLVTVDDVDEVTGQLALVLATANLIQNPGQGGDYGVKGGVSLLPPP